MSKSDTFNQISEMKPDFFVNMGDMHYSSRNKSSKEQFAFAYHEVFKSASQRNLYQNTPLVYTFDDHDVGDNNADAHSKSSSVVNQAYRVRPPSLLILLGAPSSLPLSLWLRSERHPAELYCGPSPLHPARHEIVQEYY